MSPPVDISLRIYFVISSIIARRVFCCITAAHRCRGNSLRPNWLNCRSEGNRVSFLSVRPSVVRNHGQNCVHLSCYCHYCYRNSIVISEFLERHSKAKRAQGTSLFTSAATNQRVHIFGLWAKNGPL